MLSHLRVLYQADAARGHPLASPKRGRLAAHLHDVRQRLTVPEASARLCSVPGLGAQTCVGGVVGEQTSRCAAIRCVACLQRHRNVLLVYAKADVLFTRPRILSLQVKVSEEEFNPIKQDCVGNVSIAVVNSDMLSTSCSPQRVGPRSHVSFHCSVSNHKRERHTRCNNQKWMYVPGITCLRNCAISSVQLLLT